MAEWSAAKRELLARRLRGGPAAPDAQAAIPRRADRRVAPLSFVQRQMWVIDQVMPGNPAYNLPNGFRLRGRLVVEALERAINAVVARHEVLRTTFEVQDGEPVQRIHDTCTIAIALTAVDHLDEEARERTLGQIAAADATASFDLARLPLLRVSIVRLSATEHVLLINFHHIVSDGLSVQLFLAEVATFYRIFSGGRAQPPGPLTLQYGDYASWQRQTADADADVTVAAQIEFWRRQLDGVLPVLELCGDKPRPPVQSFKGSNVFFTIPASLANDLKKVGAQEDCTFFMTMLAAFEVLLHRYTGAEDLVIGTPVALRSPREVEPLIGNFLNVAALRCDLSRNPTFRDVLRRSRNVTLDALSNSAGPFEAVIEQLRFQREPSRNPVFQVMLQVLTGTTPAFGDLDIEPFHFDLGFAQFDLSLHLYEEGRGYLGRIEYCTDLFEAQTIERLSANFLELLRSVAGDAGEEVAKIRMLAASERSEILDHWNDTAAPFPDDQLVHQLFEAQSALTPARTALIHGTQAVPYGELAARAAKIAGALRARGIAPGQRVGLRLERGPDMVAAILGILETGAAYVPLDPAFPEARLRFIAEDAQLALTVSASTLSDADLLASMPESDLIDESPARPEDPAYVIYTSGSTGRPKGVVVPHRAVVNLLTCMQREPGLTADDVVIAVTTVSFDVAVLDLFLPLAVGATIVMATRDEAMDGSALRSLLERHRATVMQATPVTWRLLLDAGWTPAHPFRALVAGEALPVDLAAQLVARGVELWNMYGPTETTVYSTGGRVKSTSNGVTIGRPIANTTIRILDQSRRLCPVGVPGELCIGGAGVSLGYWNREELTAERFIADPFNRTLGARLYLTGDRARWRNDGTIEHLGRYDLQIKLRGFRIEPGEIEAVIATHPGVRAVAVIAREDAPGDRRLVAYVVVAEDAAAGLIDQVRALVQAALPEYMVPSQFVRMDVLPLTANGKLDRMALSTLPLNTPPLATAAAPRTATEEMVLGVFRDVLGRPDAGVLDNFFDLGGHSLMAARLMLRLRAASGCNVPLRVLFERSTAAGLAEAIDALGWTAAAAKPPRTAGGRVEITL